MWGCEFVRALMREGGRGALVVDYWRVIVAIALISPPLRTFVLAQRLKTIVNMPGFGVAAPCIAPT